MIERQLTSHILQLSKQYPVIALTGPRQSGKTTLLKNAFPDYRYVTLEDPNNREFALDDAIGFLKKYNERVIFDEVQQAPQLFSYIQSIVDERNLMGQFILSGSQNFLLLQSITQSLAGRVAIFKLLPFDFTELRNANMLTDNYVDALTKGFYPALFNRKIDPTVFYANYLQTYVERDVLQLLNVRNLTQFRTFILLCASRVGQLLNIANLANECQITQPTAKSWLSILESSYIIFLLPPYHKNFNKRLVKSPKLYFYDTGLVSHLLGVKTADELNQSLKGSLFENMIISEFLKQNEHQYLLRNFYFWRDSNGLEVDLMHINSSKINIFEIKSSSTITSDSFKGLKAFQEIAGTHIGQKTLIYAGTENQERTQYLVRAWCDKRLMSD